MHTRWPFDILLVNISGLQRITKNLRKGSNVIETDQLTNNQTEENIKETIINIFREVREDISPMKLEPKTRRNNSNWIVVMVAHLCKFTNHQWIIQLNWMGFMACKLH